VLLFNRYYSPIRTLRVGLTQALGVMSMCASTRWEPISGIVSPAADLSFCYSPPENLRVKMHFSNVVGASENDLSLTFSGVIAAQWESESFGLIPIPEPLPTCSSAKWSTWTFPLLHIENSIWWAAHDARNPVGAEGKEHFVLVTMNELLHVLAEPNVSATWIPSEK